MEIFSLWYNDLATWFQSPGIQGGLTVIVLGMRLTITLGIVYMCWALSKLQFANKFTWRLKAISYGHLATLFLINYVLRDQVIKIFSGYGLALVWFVQYLMFAFVVGIFVSYLRIYFSARRITLDTPRNL